MVGQNPRVSKSNRLRPKLRNINLHNVMHSLISQNPRERMFVFQISLLIIVIILSLISQNLSLPQTIQDVDLRPRIAHAYATLFGTGERSGPHHTIKMVHFLLLCSVTCYTCSIVSRVHVNTTKLCNITCALVDTCVILWSLECPCCDLSAIFLY